MKRLLQVLLPLLVVAGIGYASHIGSTRVEQALERALNVLGQWKYLDIASQSTPPLSSTGSARLYYDTTDGAIKLSTDGADYSNLTSGGTTSGTPTDLQLSWLNSTDGRISGVNPSKPLGLVDGLTSAREVLYRWNPSSGFETVKPVGPTRTILDTNSPLSIYGSDGTLLRKITNDGTTTGVSASGTACVVVESLAAADDNMLFLSAKQAMTIKSVWCNYQGSAPSTVAIPHLEDGDGNSMTHTDPVCAAPGTEATAQSITAAGSLVAREILRFDVTNTPDPATDTYMICVSYQYD